MAESEKGESSSLKNNSASEETISGLEWWYKEPSKTKRSEDIDTPKLWLNLNKRIKKAKKLRELLVLVLLYSNIYFWLFLSVWFGVEMA